MLTIKTALLRAIEDTEADGGTPTPVSSAAASPAPSNAEELESALLELLSNEKWSSAVSFVKHHKGQMNRENETNADADDDVSFIVNVYCKKAVQDRPGTYLLCFVDILFCSDCCTMLPEIVKKYL